jgi:hypothetical protein
VAVLRVGLFLASTVVLIGASALSGDGRAQDANRPPTLFEMPVPGGIRAALAVINDRLPADRSQFLLDVIRRSHNPLALRVTEPDAVLRPLTEHFDRYSVAGPAASNAVGGVLGAGTSPATAASGSSTPTETVPLPLSPDLWKSAVFGGRPSSPNLITEILQSRNASRFYYGLLSLDDDTRAWLATQPDLIAEVSARYSATFVLAAPGLRVKDGALRVPGGGPATAIWEALAGRRTTAIPDFLRALLTTGEGRLAYFFGAMSQLTPAQIAYAMRLDAADSAARVDAGRRLYTVFDHVSEGWKVEDRPLWRPSLDPALLVSDLNVDDNGRPTLPGTQRFWTAALADADPAPPKAGRDDEAGALAEGEPVDFAWLCEQIFKGSHVVRRRPYQQVLFASRVIKEVKAASARDSLDALRAAGIYPALVGTLERAGLSDVRAYANAARRATRLSTIGDHVRLTRDLAQFQGALAFLTRAAIRQSLSEQSLSTFIASLAAVEPNDRGDYEGRLVQWLTDTLEAQRRAQPDKRSGSSETPKPPSSEDDRQSEPFAAGSIESMMLGLLAGPSANPPQFVQWEGTRYRVDHASAENARLAGLLGEHPCPYLTSAHALVTAANAFGDSSITKERLRGNLDEIEQVSRVADWDRELAAAFQRVKRDAERGGSGTRTPVVAALRGLADDLLARGLTQLAYAVAMGQRDRAVISADDAASRHDFGLKNPGADRGTPWQMPAGGAERMRNWRVTGSLLGMDVRLAEFSLLSLSSRPPANRPTLNDLDRRLFIETAVLMEPSRLTQTRGDAVVSAVEKGRARLAAVRTDADVAALADEIRLSPIRRTLLSWNVAYDPARVPGFLSLTELLWLGLGKIRLPADLNAWGAPAEGRIGCVCLEMPDRRPLETLNGRWDSGMLASGFADLNLRLTELLAELKMPASLLGPVLASATLDFVTNATSRDPDDRRGLVEFVKALRPERLEMYLALLTTDGPLVPVGESSAPDMTGGGIVPLHEPDTGVAR